MDEIEKMSWGYWRPSPGSVYPLLDELITEGMVSKKGDGKYELTEKGTEDAVWPFGVMNQQPSSVESMLTEMAGFVSYFEDLIKSDKSRITPHRERLRSLAEKLSRVAGQV